MRPAVGSTMPVWGARMSEPVRFLWQVDGDDFSSAGEASVLAKRSLRELGFDAELIRRVAVAMYEGEINMVIHAHGGEAEMLVDEDAVRVILRDVGPGIPDVELAMQAGYSTATDSVRALGFGAGMGLPNMKRFADELVVDSRVGEGTTIEMTFR